MPFERARTLLAKGRLHRRRKEKRLADETLREALATSRSLGAPIWADRARTSSAASAGDPERARELTETERRSPSWRPAASRRRQIAERAFLAPKTVGNVLGRVYEKLGIHSRAELGAFIAAGRPPGGRSIRRPTRRRPASSDRREPH